MIENINDIMVNDRRVNIREIAETVHISNQKVQNMLRTHLDEKAFPNSDAIGLFFDVDS